MFDIWCAHRKGGMFVIAVDIDLHLFAAVETSRIGVKPVSSTHRRCLLRDAQADGNLSLLVAGELVGAATCQHKQCRTCYHEMIDFLHLNVGLISKCFFCSRLAAIVSSISPGTNT